MPTPRHGLAAAVLDGKIYVVGGSNGSAPSGALEVYDPAQNSWRRRASMPTARVFLAAAALDGKLYAMGGSPDCCGNGRTDTVEVYDPGSDSWSNAPPLPLALQTSAGAAANGKIYVLGGFIPGQGVQGSTFEYDPKAKAWAARAAMPDPRDQAPAAVLTEGGVETPHVLGGSVDCHCKARGTHSSYTPSTTPQPLVPDVVIQKQVVPADHVSPGGTVHYTITVTNQGTAAASGVAVADDLAATGLLAPLWCKGKGCTPLRSGNLADTLGLAVNESVTYEVTGTAPCSCGRTRIDNTACAQAPGQEKRCARATLPIDPAPPGDLALTVTGPASLTDCSGLSYAIQVTNQGTGTACGTTLQVRPPPGSTLLSISAPCTGPACPLGDLAPGAEIPLTAKLSLPAGLQCPTSLPTVVSVTSCDSETKTFETQVPCNLSVTKTDGLDKAHPGDQIPYTMVVKNQGCAAVSGAAVADPFPAAFENAKWRRGAGPFHPGPLVDALDLPAGGQETYQASGTVSLQFPVPGNLVNTVTVTSPGPSQVSATDVTLIEAPPPPQGIIATCTQIYGTPFEGGGITKVFVIANDGPLPQGDNPGPEFMDTLPAGLTLTSATASSGAITIAGDTVRWDGPVPVNDMVTIQIDATVDAGTVGTTICNGATVYFDADGNGGNESSRALVPCCLTIQPTPPVIPGLSTSGLAVLALLLSALGLTRIRGRFTRPPES